GLVVERDHGGDRSEDLLAGDPIFVCGFYEGARIPEALLVRHFAAEKARGVTGDKTVHRLPMLRTDQWAHLGGFVGGIADANAARRLHQEVQEPVVDRALDEDARARTAVLPRVVEHSV